MKTYVTPDVKIMLLEQTDILTGSNDTTNVIFDERSGEWLVGGSADWWN